MSCLTARTGRQRQRYEDQLRLVSGCIPYRFEKTVESSNCNVEKKLLVLMISSPNRDDLVFPKGGWENDETMHEAACREALEEAGVKGVLGGFSASPFPPVALLYGLVEESGETPLGKWEFRSKSKQNNGSLQGGCRGYMFALRVTEELDSWPEQAIYGRKWVTIEDAFIFCRYDWMREALRKLLTVLSDSTENGPREEADELPLRPVISEVGSEHQMSSPSGCFTSTSHSTVQQLAA